MRWNYCPECSHRVYKHNAEGCEHVETTGHVVKISGDETFTLKHSMSERENDRLFDCQIHTRLMQVLPVMFLKAGEYAVVEDVDGELGFKPPDEARTPCDCEVKHAQLVVMT